MCRKADQFAEYSPQRNRTSWVILCIASNHTTSRDWCPEPVPSTEVQRHRHTGTGTSKHRHKQASIQAQASGTSKQEDIVTDGARKGRERLMLLNIVEVIQGIDRVANQRETLVMMVINYLEGIASGQTGEEREILVLKMTRIEIEVGWRVTDRQEGRHRQRHGQMKHRTYRV